MKAKIYNLIVLDKSGSMHSIAQQAVAGVNETIGTIKAESKKNNETTEQFVSLYIFCGCNSGYLMQNVPAEEAKMISDNEYMPCCSTPLYDSLGHSLNDLYKLTKDDENAVASVTIITDGYENSSREYHHSDIKALIERLKGEGWLFAYIGAEHDVETVSISLSIDHHMAFDKTDKGTQAMFMRERNSRSKWNSKLCESMKANRCINLKKRMTELNTENYWDETEE